MPFETAMLSEGQRETPHALCARSCPRRRTRYPKNRRLHDLIHSEAESRDAVRASEAIHRSADDATTRTKRRIRTIPARSHRSKPSETRKAGSQTRTNRLRGTVKLIWASPIAGSKVDFFNTIRTKLPLILICAITGFSLNQT